jgi:hypothetical protein
MTDPMSAATFLEEVAGMLCRDVDCAGAFTQTARIAGHAVLSHRLSFSTGMGWLHFRSRYLKAFGIRCPDWLDFYHPWVRLRLCRLAVVECRLLPPVPPFPELMRTGNGGTR